MKFDVILVVAGGITPQGLLPENVKRRIRFAQTLFDRGCAPRIIFSGRWSTFWQHQPPEKTEAELMLEYAKEIGLPPNKILLEDYSHNTYENILYSTKLFLEPHNWRSLIVVTSDFHVERVKKIIRHICGKRFAVAVVGAKTNRDLLQNLRQHSKEAILLRTQWFFQNFFYRSQ
jgi:uncharacterized SAM-binding protein YcdF (DUF218 family)